MKTDSNSEPQTHAEFLASLREAHANGRPISYFRQWPVEYLVEAGLPRDWLEKCGLVKTDGTATDLPNQCSQRQFAEIVSKLYGKPINQASVSRAIKDGLSVAVTPSNGRLKTDAALRWWEQNKAGVGGSAVATEAEDKAARQRIAREREQLELDAIKKKSADAWMLTEFHDFWCEGVATRARQSALSMLKRVADLAKQAAKESGADDALTEKMISALRPKLDADFESWQADFTKQVEELDKSCWELSEQKKTEL